MSTARALTSSRTTAATAFLVLALPSCFWDPYNGQTLAHRGDQLTFSGVTTEPEMAIAIEAQNFDSGGWDIIGIAKADKNPIVPAGHWNGSPALYAVSDPNYHIGDQDNRWVFVPGCLEPCAADRWRATLRVRKVSPPGGFLYAGEAGSLSCFSDAADDGKNFYQAGLDCGFDTQTFYVFAHAN